VPELVYWGGDGRGLHDPSCLASVSVTAIVTVASVLVL